MVNIDYMHIQVLKKRRSLNSQYSHLKDLLLVVKLNYL